MCGIVAASVAPMQDVVSVVVLASDAALLHPQPSALGPSLECAKSSSIPKPPAWKSSAAIA
jgi:hypothetical protein